MQKYQENLEIYDLEGKFLKIQNRDKFYKEIRHEYKKSGKIYKRVKTISLILVNSAGRIYIQKRSRKKSENAGLYDKTVGGHVTAGQSNEVTVVLECHQELGFPITVLPEDQFEKAIKVTDLNIIGLAKLIAQKDDCVSVRKTKTGEFRQPVMTSFYLGYYDGAIRFIDGESTGIEVFELAELTNTISKEPNKFTEDIKSIVSEYGHLFKPLSKNP